MRTILANGTAVDITPEVSPHIKRPAALANFLLALDDAVAELDRVYFVADGTHFHIDGNLNVTVAKSGAYYAPQWNPKGTPITWDDDPDNGISAGTGTATGVYVQCFAVTYYGVTRDDDGYRYWVKNPTRRH